jgi:hypothetical protein
MTKIFYYLAIMWLFISCADEEGLTGNDGGNPDWRDNNVIGRTNEGFQPHNRHFYGYYYVSSSKTAHISIPISETGYVKVLTDSKLAENYGYYYCEPDRLDTLRNLDYIPADEKAEHEIEIAASSPSRIGLCRKEFGGMHITKVQELQVHRYNWKEYNFYVYTFGNRDTRNRFTENQSFWREFDDIFGQAIVKNDYFFKNSSQPVYLPGQVRQREYVLSRARGNYDNDYAYERVKCAEGDIGEAMDEIENEAYFEKRAVLQVDYPTKRFWPLKIGRNGYQIELCGRPDFIEDPTRQQSPPIYLELEPLPNPPYHLFCEYRIDPGTPVFWYEPDQSWYLIYGNNANDIELATIDNAHPECAVFAERGTYALGRQYVGEISDSRRAAEMVRKPDKRVAIAILPWQGTLNETKRVAFHELGHTMGLDDVRERGNLMFYGSSEGSTRLQRNLTSNTNSRQENQWECLQEINVGINCASPLLVHRGP